MDKIKILAIGDHVTKTGFSRVLEGILTNLPKKDYSVAVLGVNYYGDPHNLPYRVYPAMTPRYPDPLGMPRVPELVNKEHPDVIFLLSDVWVLNDYLATLKKTFEKGRPKIITYFPVDASDHSPQWYKNFDIVDAGVVYTEFGKQVASKALPDFDFKIIPHGFDPKIFYKIDAPKSELKKLLFSKDPAFYTDSFVVLNANRNQPRKKLWITMEGFKLFSENKPENVRLYMHCGLRDSDIDIGDLAVRLGIDTRLHVSSVVAGPQQVTEERLNLIYNCADVGVNTSSGEGWGLCNFEHGATGAPQVVPDNSANPELHGDCGVLVPTTMDDILTGIMTRGSVVRPEDVAEKLELLYTNKELYNELSTKTYEKFNSEKYYWSTIAESWDNLIKETIVG